MGGVVSLSCSWAESGVVKNEAVEGVRAEGGASDEGMGCRFEVEPDSTGVSGCLMSLPAAEEKL